jgi:hypothetical protein
VFGDTELVGDLGGVLALFGLGQDFALTGGEKETTRQAVTPGRKRLESGSFFFGGGQALRRQRVARASQGPIRSTPWR